MDPHVIATEQPRVAQAEEAGILGLVLPPQRGREAGYPRSHARHVPSSPTNSTRFFFLLDAIGWNQFELCPNGRLRYANSARYKNAGMIKKEAFVSPGVLDQARRIIEESGIVEVDPSSWPQATDRKQELEIKMGKTHATFACAEIGSLLDIQKSNDPEGLKKFYYLTQDLKTYVFSLVSLHFRIRPIS